MSSRVVQIRERKQCESCLIPFDPVGDETVCPVCAAWDSAIEANERAAKAFRELCDEKTRAF